MHTSSTSFAAALVATALIASSSSGVEALPTHRSTSTISRRAHLASHGHAHVARSSGTAASLGDHSIVVDASTSSAQGNGGIKNSTINLTSISRRSDTESTFSSFARVVRSLFSSSSSTSSSTSSSPSNLPLTTRSTRRSHGTQPPKHVRRLPLAQRSIALAGAKAPRSALRGATRSHEQQVKRRKEGGHNHPRNVKQQQRRSPSPNPYPPPPSSAAVSPRVEPRAITYDAAAAQASAYSAAVAALASSDSEPTASPVVEAALASPSANAAAYAGLDSSSLFNANSSSAALPPIVMTVTQTVTLVPSGLGGAYVDAAGLSSSPAPLPTSVSAVNPKAVPSASPSSSSDSSAATEQEEPLSTLVLPLSPSPSASPSPSTGMERRVKRGIAHKRARQVHVGGKAVEGSKVVWYHAPHASE